MTGRWQLPPRVVAWQLSRAAGRARRAWPLAFERGEKDGWRFWRLRVLGLCLTRGWRWA